MQKMLMFAQNVVFRFCLFLCSLCLTLRAAAQEDEDTGPYLKLPDLDLGEDEVEPFDMTYFSFGFADVLLIVLVLVVAYLLSKVWKGCTYGFLFLVALAYFLNYYLY